MTAVLAASAREATDSPRLAWSPALPAPATVPLSQILPDEPLLMMGAGPVPLPAAVAQANSLVINHLGATMGRVLDHVKAMARYVFQTASPYVLGVAGPGSAAMEMAITNLVEPSTRVLSVLKARSRSLSMASAASASRACSKLCCWPDCASRSWITCQPKSVRTGSLTCPACMPKSAVSNARSAITSPG